MSACSAPPALRTCSQRDPLGKAGRGSTYRSMGTRQPQRVLPHCVGKTPAQRRHREGHAQLPDAAVDPRLVAAVSRRPARGVERCWVEECQRSHAWPNRHEACAQTCACPGLRERVRLIALPRSKLLRAPSPRRAQTQRWVIGLIFHAQRKSDGDGRHAVSDPIPGRPAAPRGRHPAPPAMQAVGRGARPRQGRCCHSALPFSVAHRDCLFKIAK